MSIQTRRNWLSSEWETVDVECGRFVYGREDDLRPTKGIPAITATRPWVSTSLAVIPSQVDSMNQAVRDAGLRDVSYRPDGKLSCESNAGRNAEMKRRGKFDGDAGYSQHAGS